MKKNSTFRSHIQRQSRRRNSTLSLESLEDRHLLAANVLASVADSISSANPGDDVDMTISTPGASSSDMVTLMIHMSATDENLDPAAPVIRSVSGPIVTPISAVDDAVGSSGMTVVTLAAGDYTVETSAEGGTTGTYIVEVSVFGDVETADSRVTSFERLRTSAALIQALGTGSHVTDLFFAQHGIDMAVSQYDAGFDANMSGDVNPFEVSIVESNESIGLTMVTLQSDVDGPTVDSLRLVNDTGTSDTDNISTDARVSGRVQDDNTITQVSVSLDGGAAVDVTADLGDLSASSGFFTLTRSLLDDLAGGSLAPGAHSVTIAGVDEFENETTSPQSFSFVLIEDNDGPTVSGEIAATIAEDSPLSFDVSGFFDDADPGDVLTFTATGLPGWLSITSTGVFQGTPLNDDVGFELITVNATDSQGLGVMSNATITITNTPDAPVIAPIVDQFPEEDVLFTLDLDISDPDVGDMLTISVDQADGIDSLGDPINLQPLPSWLSFDDETLILSGTPTDADIGSSFQVFVLAVDEGGLTDSEIFRITVQDINDPPVLETEIPDETIDEGSPYTLDLNNFFTDSDVADSLTFSATLSEGASLPQWLNLNSSTGIFSGTPDDPDVGVVLEIAVTATDLSGAFAEDTYSLTVNNINDAPVANDATFEVLPTTASGTVVGTVDVSDEDVGDTVTITATGGGGNFDVDPTTGIITVANGANLADGESFTLDITATDVAGASDTAVVTIDVDATAVVEFFVRTFDVEGSEIATIQPGTAFELRVFVEDVRTDPQGVFAPFVDVTYDAALASVTGPIVHSSTYMTVPEGDASTPGLLDEVGGLDGLTPIGGGEFEVFRIAMLAGATPGVIDFVADPADDEILHAVLVYLIDDPIPNGQILFGSTSLTIAGPIPPLSGSVPGTNFDEPMDTNSDLFVSPVDALVVINAMETGSSDFYPDVNADGVVSPMDALAIVNYLNTSTPQAPLSASASATEATIDFVDSVPTSESSGAGSLSPGNFDMAPESNLSSADEVVLAAWNAEADSEVAVDQDDEDEATRAIDAIFGELG